MKARDLGRLAGTHSFRLGSGLSEVDITSFTLTIDKGIVAPDAFANNMLNLPEPGQEETRSITLDVEGQLPQDYYTADNPIYEFINKTTSKAAIVYAADTSAALAIPYYICFQIPAMRWTEVSHSIAGGGIIQFRASARAIEGSITAMAAPYNEHPTIGATTDLRVLVGTNSTDDGDAKFTGALSGNPLPDA